MITAVDTSVLVDVFGADPVFGDASADALRRCRGEGQLVACDVVWAEVTAAFSDPVAAMAVLDTLGVEFSPLDRDAASAAGTAWSAYRERSGSRERVIADFLIGAHAGRAGDRLLTRDRGFYRSYFGDLQILDPSRE